MPSVPTGLAASITYPALVPILGRRINHELKMTSTGWTRVECFTIKAFQETLMGEEQNIQSGRRFWQWPEVLLVFIQGEKEIDSYIGNHHRWSKPGPYVANTLRQIRPEKYNERDKNIISQSRPRRWRALRNWYAMFDQYHCRSPKTKYSLAAKDARKKKDHPRTAWLALNTQRLHYAILIKQKK